MRVSFKQPLRSPRSLSPHISTHAARRHVTLIAPPAQSQNTTPTALPQLLLPKPKGCFFFLLFVFGGEEEKTKRMYVHDINPNASRASLQFFCF